MYKCAFYGGLRHYETEDTMFGAFSLIFWTITLLSLIKYMVFVLRADDNGEGKDVKYIGFPKIKFLYVLRFMTVEFWLYFLLHAGGIFALYALLCRHTRFSLLLNQQAADEEISTYYGPGDANRSLPSSDFKRLIEHNKRSKTALLLLVLAGTSMVITIGVLTPAVSGKRDSLLSWFCLALFFNDYEVLGSEVLVITICREDLSQEEYYFSYLYEQFII